MNSEVISQTTEADSPPPRRQTPDSTKGFWALIVTQFQGAFSDNALKTLVTFVGLNMALTASQHELLLPLTTVLFSLPFILFSMAGGFLADRLSKRTVILGVKFLEILIMTFATTGFFLQNLPMGLAAIFFMGVHSAIFGPSKYGSLPELLPDRKLSWGNGILELGTFIAIILGMAAGTQLFSVFKGREGWAGAVLIGLATVGLLFSLGITRVPAADPKRKFRANFIGDLWQQIQTMRTDRVLWLACLGNIYFSFIGVLIQQGVLDYGENVLKIGETRTMFFLVALAVGIGLGSFAAGYLSGGKIEYGLVPLGSLGLCAFAALLWNPHLSFGWIIATLGALGFFGGFFIVPVSAILQHRPDKEKKGVLLAAANLLSFVGVFAAGGAYWLITAALNLGPRAVFLICALMTFAATVYVLTLLPDALLRFVLWMLTNSIYRIRVIGRENIPSKGGALFVCNHVSYVDALLMLASTDRKVRFMMLNEHYHIWWMKPFVKMLDVIPISSQQHPREMLKSLQTASDAIKNGEVVCIFAEGQITRIGQMLPFRRGFERIMKEVDAPIIPVALDNVWGSIFSFEGKKFVWKWPRRIPYRVTVCFGKALPHTTTPFEARQVVQGLMTDAWHHRRKHMKPLHRAFVRVARKHPRRFAMADAQTKNVSFGDALTRSVLLARRLKKVWAGQKMVGLLLPPSVPGALVNWAAMLCGKVPVNLNYTVSEQTLASCIQQCEIKTVITSRAFLEKVKLTVPCETIFLEDVIGAERRSPTRREESSLSAHAGSETGVPTAFEKLTAFLMARFLPVAFLERALASNREPQIVNRKSLDSLATVIFSSGSTGEPKGVMLSHYNIVSNIEQMEQIFNLTQDDRVLGVLPFFHSFGFTGTLCLPALLGSGVVFHSNPLDAKTIGPLVREHKVTFLLATPTFLQLYMRGCAPEDFGSLRAVVTGAEKLPERLANAFEEQFGIRPLEGYGCTECAPAVALNTQDFRAAGFMQVGSKRGKIGHPLPGVSVRIVNVDDPHSEKPVPIGESGLLLVRGPNVMMGYLGKPERTAEVLFDDPGSAGVPPASSSGNDSGRRDARAPRAKWYLTGDVAMLDEDGFLQITDRLSRFSKIGGEMIPHIKIEEKLHELAGVTEQTFVVTGVPDEKKGERLVVLHKLADDKLHLCLEKIAQSDLPNLWKPKADAFLRVESFPMLGTGKLDLRKVRESATLFSAKSTTVSE